MVFMVNKDSGIKSKDDLKGKKVAVQNGSTAQDTLKGADIYSDLTVSELGTNVEAIQQLELKMVDAVFLDSVVADYEITSTGKPYETLSDTLYEEQYAVGFKLGANELCKKIEDTLKEMKKDGKTEEIAKKWFGSDVTTIK
jgi:polar amino acid transport system substrate-binding protein